MLRSIRAWLFGGEADDTSEESCSRPFQAPSACPALDEHPPGKASFAANAPPAACPEQGYSPAGWQRDEVVASRQERAAERLLDDERLRGDLTDDQFQPLLDWALGASDGLVVGTAGFGDDVADELVAAGLNRIREVVRGAGRAVSAMLDGGPAARNAELAALADLVGPPLVSHAAVASARARLSAALEPVIADPSLAGSDLASAVAEALRSLGPPGEAKDGPTA